MKAPLPPTEDKRLEVLQAYQILDTPPEQEFDDLTHLAAQICGTPISTITLIDQNRQWFKSKIGVEASETSRDLAFCAHTILGDDLFVVPDATADSRFFDNQLVTSDPNIRFYAGMPLQTSEGQNLGTLCVIDRVPRHLDAMQLEALRILGGQVVLLLERRRALMELLESQRFLSSTLDALASHIAVLDARGTIIAVNEAWRKFAAENDGSQDTTNIGANYIEVCQSTRGPWAKEAGEVAAGIRAVIARTRSSFALEYPCHGPDEHLWFNLTVTRFDETEPVRVVVAHENITARKLAEQQLQRHSHLLDVVGQAVIVADPEGAITYWNDYARQLYGWSAEEVMGRNILDVTPTDNTQQQAAEIMACLARGERWEGEFLTRNREGKEFPVHVTDTPVLDENGQVTSIIGISLDITERKQAEEALHKSEASLLASQAYAQLGNWEMDFATLTGTWSAEMARLHYRNPAGNAPTYAEFLELVHPEDRAQVESVQSRVPTATAPIQHVYRTNPNLGPVRYLRTTLNILRDEVDSLPRVVGITLDVTEQQQAEAQIRQIFERITDAVVAIDNDSKYTFVNEKAGQILGREPKELIGKNVWDETYEGDNQEFRLMHEQARREQQPIVAERYYAPNDVWIESHLYPSPEGLTIYFQDISERKQAENALHRNNELLRAVTESTSDAIFAKDLDRRYLWINRAGAKFVGHSVEEIVGRTDAEFRLPEDAEAAMAKDREIIASGAIQTYEMQVMMGDSPTTFLSTKGPLRGPNGDVVGIVGIARDITERKQAEIALRESEERFRAVVEQAAVGICLVGMDYRFQRVNRRFSEILGYPAEELLDSHNCVDTTHPDDKAADGEAVARLLAGASSVTVEKRYVRKDETIVWARLTLSILHSSIGEAQQFIGVVEDITERKLAEQRLTESEKQLTTIYNSVGDMIIYLSVEAPGQYRFVSVNEAALEATGLEAGQMVGKLVTDVIPEPSLSLVLEKYQQAIAENKTLQWEETTPYPRGIRTAQVSITPLDNEQGVCTHLVGSIHDITDRREAEAALRESEIQFRAVFDNALDAIVITDNEGRFQEINAAACELYGVERAQLLNMKLSDFIEADRNFPQMVQDFRASHIEKGEFPIILPDNTRKYVEFASTADFLPDRHLTALRDITERKQATQASERLAAIVNSSNDAIIGKTLDGIITSWNAGAEKLYGYSCEEVIDRSASLLLLADRPNEETQLLARIARGESVENHETVRVRKDGSTVEVSLTFSPVKNEAGKITAVSVIARDITQRKQAERELRESEERFQRMVTNVPGLVYQCVTYPDGSFEWPFVSQEFVEIYEVEPQVLVSQPSLFVDMIHPDDKFAALDSLQAAASTLSPLNWEGRLRMASGRVKWVQVAMRPQPLTDGAILWDGLVFDNTAHKEAEHQRDRFFAMSLDMLCISGFDGYFQRVNPAFTVALGHTEKELMEIPFANLVHPDDLPATQEAVAQLAAGGILVGFENRYRHRDGSWHWLEWKAIAEVEAGLIYAAAHDITERKANQAALLKARDELEARVTERTAELGQANETLRVENIEHQMTMGILRFTAKSLEKATAEANLANQAKSEFLSRMSHELRTPLNAILGFGQILEHQNLSALQQESVDYILKGGRHLLDLINEVLDISRVEAGQVDLSLEPISLDDIVPDTCALVRPLAAEHQIRLAENAEKMSGLYVQADRQRLKQVLINLLGNAIKYNRKGGQVEISCHSTPDGKVAIAIRDTGPGIAPQDIAKLFIPFERLNAGATNVEGTGLGLVLSQRLVTAMAGTIEVKSTVGVGTTFTVVLPHAIAPEKALASSLPTALTTETGKTIEHTHAVLCIEDNPSNLRLIEAILGDRPEITLLSAIQGSVGLDLARQHEPDLILLDLNLPDIHGSEVLARLQKSALTRDIPVVVVSADATARQIEKLMAAGASDYLTKPLDVRQFLRTVDKFLQPTPELGI